MTKRTNKMGEISLSDIDFENDSYYEAELWECQHCHKHFPATDEFGRVESDLGFLCHKCAKELTAEGVELHWEDEL